MIQTCAQTHVDHGFNTGVTADQKDILMQLLSTLEWPTSSLDSKAVPKCIQLLGPRGLLKAISFERYPAHAQPSHPSQVCMMASQTLS